MRKIGYEFLLIAALIVTFGAGAAFAQNIARPSYTLCDEFVYQGDSDSVKARLDNCSIQIQTTPDSQLYIIIHPGTVKNVLSYNIAARRAMQYLVGVKKVDQNRIVIVRGPNLAMTTYQIYIVPPGAEVPAPK